MKLKQWIKWYQWTRWFAWYPIKTCDNEYVWLEYVERRIFQDNKVDFAPVEKQYKRIETI